MNLQELQSLQGESIEAVKNAADPAAIEQARIKYLGRNGLIPHNAAAIHISLLFWISFHLVDHRELSRFSFLIYLYIVVCN